MTPADLDSIVTHHTKDVGGLKMHWVEAGAGPTVVLLHGFPEMWWSWRHQIVPLAEAGFRVVVPDQRGYGDTGKQGPYDLETLSLDIGRLIDALGAGQKARIVSHDWGGAVAWYLAARHPRFVERLAVLNCPHPMMFRTAMSKPSQVLKSWYMFFFQVPVLVEWLLTKDNGANILRMLKGNAVNRANYSDAELEPFRQAMLKPGAAKAMLGWYRAIPSQIFSPPPVAPIDVETLIVWGMKDTALGFDELVPGTERWAPKLKVVRIDDAAHFVQSDDPAAVNRALIGFLTA